MSDSGTDAILDRIAELLKLCAQADENGRHVISTATVRGIFGPREVHPASRWSALPKRTP